MAHRLSHTGRPLLTEREVGDLWMVTPRTVRRWAKRGVITPVRIGGITRYRATEVWTLIDPETSDDGRRSAVLDVEIELTDPEDSEAEVGNPRLRTTSAVSGDRVFTAD